MQIFDALLRKFLRLHKTKEEMVKYCMRKSFKFAVDRLRKRENTHDRNSIAEYFQENEQESFVVPFK